MKLYKWDMIVNSVKNKHIVDFMGASIHSKLGTPPAGAEQAYWED